MEYSDDIVFFDDQTNEKLVFNFKTWILTIKGIIVNYAKKTEEEADNLIKEKIFIIPRDYTQVIFYSHETEYHWAMLVVYGEGYWHKGISSIEPHDYDEWNQNHRKINFLKQESFEFMD